MNSFERIINIKVIINRRFCSYIRCGTIIPTGEITINIFLIMKKKLRITSIGEYITIIIGGIIVFGIILIIAFFNISSNSTKLTKQMDLLNKQMDYLIQLEERKQGINQNSPQNVPQNYNNSGFDTRQ